MTDFDRQLRRSADFAIAQIHDQIGAVRRAMADTKRIIRECGQHDFPRSIKHAKSFRRSRRKAG